MPRCRLLFTAVFHDRDAVLHVHSRQSVQRLFAVPLAAERLDLDQCPAAWVACRPRVRFHRLLRWAGCAENQVVESGWRRPRLYHERDLKSSAAIAGFIRATGDILCRTVAQFRDCREQFLFLQCLQSAPAVLRFQDNPALVYAAIDEARRCDDEGQCAALLDTMATASARDLARSLGFPNDHFLRRVAAGHLTAGRLATLRDLCRLRRERRVLSHLKQITGDVIELLADPEMADHLDNRFLEQMGHNGAGERLPTATEVNRLITYLRQVSDRPVRIMSLEHFWRIRDRNPALEYVAPEDLNSLLAMNFGKPPVCDEPGFVSALRTGRQLLAESMKMRNCVAGQYEKVLSGKAWYYHIEGTWGMPRGTMEIVPEGEIWRISQIVGPGNRRFPLNCVRHAAIWLAEQQHIPDERLCSPRQGGAFFEEEFA